MSFMPMQHAKEIICHRFWTDDWLHKHMHVHLLTHARPRHLKGSWWLLSPSMCVNGVSFLLSCPPTMEAYVSRFIAHPSSKSCGGDVFTSFAIHFAMVANHLRLHMHSQILIIATTCVVEMFRFGWRTMVVIKPHV